MLECTCIQKISMLIPEISLKTTLKIWSKLVKSLKRYPFSKSEKAHSEKNWFKSWNTEWNIVVIITLHLSHSFHPNSSFPSLLSHKFHTRCPQPSPGPFLYHSTAAASPVGTNFWNWMEYRDRNRCENRKMLLSVAMATDNILPLE